MRLSNKEGALKITPRQGDSRKFRPGASILPLMCNRQPFRANGSLDYLIVL